MPRKPSVCMILCAVVSFGCSIEPMAGLAYASLSPTGSVYAAYYILAQWRLLTDPLVEGQYGIGEVVATYRKAYTRYGGALIYGILDIVKLDEVADVDVSSTNMFVVAGVVASMDQRDGQRAQGTSEALIRPWLRAGGSSILAAAVIGLCIACDRRV